MTVSKTTTQEKVQEFIERKVRELAIGSGVLMQDLFCEFSDSLTAELQKENARLKAALEKILEHAPDEADFEMGGRYDYGLDCHNSGDILTLGDAECHRTLARIARAALNPPKGGEVQEGLSKEKAK